MVVYLPSVPKPHPKTPIPQPPRPKKPRDKKSAVASCAAERGFVALVPIPGLQGWLRNLEMAIEAKGHGGHGDMETIGKCQPTGLFLPRGVGQMGIECGAHRKIFQPASLFLRGVSISGFSGESSNQFMNMGPGVHFWV